jgi:hypothetical protein
MFSPRTTTVMSRCGGAPVPSMTVTCCNASASPPGFSPETYGASAGERAAPPSRGPPVPSTRLIAIASTQPRSLPDHLGKQGPDGGAAAQDHFKALAAWLSRGSCDPAPVRSESR